MMSAVLFILGFYVLIKGSRALVDGSVSLARFFQIPEWVIGVVIVGIGTSMPEFAINIVAVFKGDPIGISTIFGSNIFNVLVILGIVAIISPPKLNPRLVTRDLLINLGAVALAGICLMFSFTSEMYQGVVRVEALLLFCVFIGWVVWAIFGSKSGKKMDTEDRQFTIGVAFVMIVLGIVGVALGGHWVVLGALRGAELFGVASSIVGVLIIGSGTSLTELAVSITAALKRKSEIAMGNIIGSNVFDFIGIIGIVGLIGNIPFGPDLYPDLLVCFGAVLLVFCFIKYRKAFTVTRFQGAMLLLVYVAYFIFTFLRTPFVG